MRTIKLTDLWCQQVGKATNLMPDVVKAMAHKFWNSGLSVPQIKTEFVKLAIANGKELIFVNRDCN